METDNNNITTATTATTATTVVEKKKRNKSQFVFKQYIINHELAAQKVSTDSLLLASYTSIARFKKYNLLAGNEQTRNNQLNQLVFEQPDTPYNYQLGKDNNYLLNFDQELLDTNFNKNDNHWPKYILDIGTGCNILSIMLGQRFGNGTIINSIDIEESAIANSKLNIETIYGEGKSITDNIYLFHTPIQDFKPDNFIDIIAEDGITVTGKKHVHEIELSKNIETKSKLQQEGKTHTPNNNTNNKYDLIICAPPYFPTDVKKDKLVDAMQRNRRVARHTHTLTMDDLMKSVKRLITPDHGLFTTIVSIPDPSDDLELAATNHGFVCLELVDITDSPSTKIVRKMYTFQLPTVNNHKTALNSDTIIRKFSIYETTIKDSTIKNHRKHSNQYKHMLNDFCNHFLKEDHSDNNNNNSSNTN